MKIEADSLSGLDGLRHGFFTREGGVSEGLYSSLNCGLGSQDRAEHVVENRRRVAAALGLAGDRLVTPYQIHSPSVIAVEAPWARAETPRGDALVTREPAIAIAVTTADCLPVLLSDPEARVVGAAHAGWRGALAGVLARTVEAMTALGARAAAIKAVIGPAIEQQSYEVGPEFPAPFLAQDEANGAFFAPGHREGRFQFDLKGYAARCLEAAGVGAVEVLAADTCAEESRFFSYRRSCLRGEGDYGRGLSVICLEG